MLLTASHPPLFLPSPPLSSYQKTRRAFESPPSGTVESCSRTFSNGNSPFSFPPDLTLLPVLDFSNGYYHVISASSSCFDADASRYPLSASSRFLSPPLFPVLEKGPFFKRNLATYQAILALIASDPRQKKSLPFPPLVPPFSSSSALPLSC